MDKAQAKTLCDEWTAAIANHVLCEEARLKKTPIQLPSKTRVGSAVRHYRMTLPLAVSTVDFDRVEVQERLLFELKRNRIAFLQSRLTTAEFWFVEPHQPDPGITIDANKTETCFEIYWESREGFTQI